MPSGPPAKVLGVESSSSHATLSGTITELSSPLGRIAEALERRITSTAWEAVFVSQEFAARSEEEYAAIIADRAGQGVSRTGG